MPTAEMRLHGGRKLILQLNAIISSLDNPDKRIIQKKHVTDKKTLTEEFYFMQTCRYFTNDCRFRSLKSEAIQLNVLDTEETVFLLKKLRFFIDYQVVDRPNFRVSQIIINIIHGELLT